MADNRNYGLKTVPEESKWMTPSVFGEILKYEHRGTVCEYLKWILNDLTTPAGTRLVSDCDSLDCLEDYWINQLCANGTKLYIDPVYHWLLVAKDFFEEHKNYEMCHNINVAISYFKRNLKAEKDEMMAAVLNS